MPRGRPPIPRTKEEALSARREQVRKNVQAFRKRKQNQDKPRASQSRTKEDGYKFVIEDLGQLDNGGSYYQCSSKYESTQSVTVERSDKNAIIVSPTQIAQRPLPQTSQCSAIRTPESFTSMSPSIDGGPASLQQYSSNFTYAFTSHRATAGPHWSQMLTSLVNRNLTLDLSIQALCLLQVSHTRGNYILPQSLSLYNRALKNLQSALTHHRGHGFMIEIFATMMILGVYELLQGTKLEGESWMAHFEGGATYINMFPSLDVSKVSPQMTFHFLEAICIFDALASRKQNTCSKSKWWRNTVDQFGGKAYGSLLRMLTSLPGVLEQCDRAMLLTSSAEAVSEWTRLLQLCLRLEHAFFNWLKRTMAAEGLESHSFGAMTADPAFVKEADIPSRIIFPDLFIARLYLLYWSAMILLQDSIEAIRGSLLLNFESTSFSDTHFLLDSILTQAYSNTSFVFATVIVRSIPFCLETQHRVLGKTILLLPLQTARRHFAEQEDAALTKECDEWLEFLGWSKLKFGLKVSARI
ncbi:hypothetical protein ACLMJK_001947 [Lecanora helva]